MNINSVFRERFQDPLKRFDEKTESFQDIEDLVDSLEINKLKEKLREKKAIFIPVPVNRLMTYHEPNDNVIVLYPETMGGPFNNVKQIVYKQTEYQCGEEVCDSLELGSLGSNTIVILDKLEKVSKVVVMFTTNYTPDTYSYLFESPVITYDRWEYPWDFPGYYPRRYRDPMRHFPPPPSSELK